MLNNDALSQLKQLKQHIEDQKEYVEGVVKSTLHRFGFLVLDDGREIYLSADEMQKVFAGDRVKAVVTIDNKNKSSATLEKLIDSPLKTFTGRYVVKGKGHFVEPDLPQFNRWIFIPPNARNGAVAGDFIHCKISRHAYPQGKPQAKVIERIGSPDKPGIEAEYMISKHALGQHWPKDWPSSITEPDTSKRADLTALAFITIDAAQTLDMDDALYAEKNDDGWQLYVAIADPAAFIATGSELDREAARRACSAYLPGKTVAMLPEALANDRCSLIAGQTRPALVCTIQLSSSGEISRYQIQEATICTQAKLHYEEVAALLDKQSVSTELSTHEPLIKTLAEISEALKAQRRQQHLLIDDKLEYQLQLNEQGKIEQILKTCKSSAHQLVEECMVAANRCAADMLGATGVFISHPGFRDKRQQDVRKLAEEQLSITDIDHQTPDGYRQLMHAVNSRPAAIPLRSVLSRMLSRSQLSTTTQPHYGMALPRYTTFTSPIRKYSDLLVHRLLKAKLNHEKIQQPEQALLDKLQQTLDKTRLAQSQTEQWLKCQFIAAQLGSQASGHITQINSRGFTVRLDDNGIEGIVETRQLPEKYSFDPMRMRLKSDTQLFELEQPLEVQIAEVDKYRRQIRFSLPTTDKAVD